MVYDWLFSINERPVHVMKMPGNLKTPEEAKKYPGNFYVYNYELNQRTSTHVPK